MEATESHERWATLATRVRGIIAEVADVPLDRVKDDVEFIADLQLDSITALELIVEIEVRCNVRVDVSNFATSGTVGRLLATIKRSLEVGSN